MCEGGSVRAIEGRPLVVWSMVWCGASASGGDKLPPNLAPHRATGSRAEAREAQPGPSSQIATDHCDLTNHLHCECPILSVPLLSRTVMSVMCPEARARVRVGELC